MITTEEIFNYIHSRINSLAIEEIDKKQMKKSMEADKAHHTREELEKLSDIILEDY